MLDSLVVFADVGDRIEVAEAPDLALTVTGPRAAGVPKGAENLVLRAARLLDPDRGAHITLEKHLPAEAGIGGGSSDAAATIRALSQLWGISLNAPATALGADVPVCLTAKPMRMQGIGDLLSPAPPLPPLWIVLSNPGVSLPTPLVFRALASKSNPAMRPQSGASVLGWLADQRNDLQEPAIGLAPEIGTCLDAISAQKGAVLSRMSGSGATCFGLFESADDAAAAAAAIQGRHPGWWTVSAPLLK